MDAVEQQLAELAKTGYEAGFVSNIESETVPPGLDESVIRYISARKSEPEFMLEWRLGAYQKWLQMEEPDWAHLKYTKIDYQAISYFSAPKSAADAPKSLDEVDPELLRVYEKLGIPLEEQKMLAGVAGGALVDSVSVAAALRKQLAEAGVIFCSISEAMREHPELIKKYLGTVVPQTDNYFAALNAAVFTDGTFVYIPENTSCRMELSA